MDACLTDWAATVGKDRTGGHRAQKDLDQVLELKSILIGLFSLSNVNRNTHIPLRSDNTATIVGINRVGSTNPDLTTVME